MDRIIHILLAFTLNEAYYFLFQQLTPSFKSFKMQFILLMPLMGLLLLMNFGACVQDLHVNRGSQSHEETLGRVHGDVYTANG